MYLYGASTRRNAMIESNQEPQPAKQSNRAIEFNDTTFLVDAALIGELLRISATRVPALMREGKITSACERGVDDHAGEFRLSFFYRNRRARLCTDPEGRILRKSSIDFGERPVPRSQHEVAGREKSLGAGRQRGERI
jgi:hypothetical protein